MQIKTILSLAFLHIFLVATAQDTLVNLIPNPGFEDVNICKKYEEPCLPEAWCSTTLKAFYYLDNKNIKTETNKAFEGDRFVSIGMHNSKRAFDRSFLQVPLLCELEAGKKYELSFYYKTPFRMLEQFGVLFRDSIVIKKDNQHLEGIQPSINFQNKNFIKPNTWVKVSQVYKARGGEKVMTLGNFSRDANTQVIQIAKQKEKSYNPKTNRTSYLFDQFNLVALDSTINCDIEKSKAQIYGNDIRHEIPNKSAKVIEVVVIEEPEPIKDMIVIEDDSIAVDKTFELPNILFESNSDQLLPIAYPSLKKLASYLIMNRTFQIMITGHTDNQGTSIFNQTLSKKRAKTVHDYLISEGISKTRISYIGKGESEPLAPNKTAEGRAQNRRVEFSLQNK